MKKAAFFNITLMLWLCWALPASAGLADTIERVRDSVVGIGSAQKISAWRLESPRQPIMEQGL